MDAKELLKLTVRDLVAPELRSLGFKGSGFKFRLPSDNGDHALLGFQSWPYNRPDLARFTANASFYGAAEWHAARDENPALPETPLPSMNYLVGWEERVGYLLRPYPHDHWWAVRQDAEEAELVARDVVAVIQGDVLPQLLARLDGNEPADIAKVVVRTSSECPWPCCEDTERAH